MPIIKTKRFLLRPLEAGDAPRLVDLCNDPDIARNTARICIPYALDDAQAFIAYAAKAAAAGEEFPFAVCRDGAVVACAGAKPHGEKACELGYWVGADHRGQGAASEAGDGVLQFALAALQPKTLTSGFFADNPASGRVLEKLGFRPTGEVVKTMSLGRGCEVDTVRVAMAPADYKPTPGVAVVLDA